ncbi:MAG: acetyl-CoA carboxylase biotin carboxyl carrier protein subunit, partial [Bacteroidales bacterium]|nr:acetyl-CoA carboxylase biotin carboxyl carrier protein subunit [Bacteroidales bacterium]
GTLASPLPGTVLDVFVKAGDAVKVGQRLLLLEAMKMENNIDADRDGVIKEVKVNKSDAVMEGQVLVVFE